MDERMAGGGGAQDLAAYADHEKTAIGVYAGLIVKRDRLLHDLAMHGRDLGISVVSGPRGFGVTALLRQYVSVVQSDPARGAAAYIDAARLDEAGVVGAMESACDAMPAGTRPLLAVDHLPRFDRDASERVASALRALRERGIEAVVGCTPIARPFMQAMGDAHKVSAQQLLVRPDEYSAWARAFALSPALTSTASPGVFRLSWRFWRHAPTVRRGGRCWTRARKRSFPMPSSRCVPLAIRSTDSRRSWC